MAISYGEELESTQMILQDLATKFDKMQRAKKGGRIVVGTWVATPYELLLAGNAFTTNYRVEQDLLKDIIKGGYDNQKLIDEFGIGTCFCIDICSSVGDPTPAAFPGYDFVVTSFPEKLREFKDMISNIGGFWDIMPLEIPRGLPRGEAKNAVAEKLELMRAKIEELTGKELAEEDIREACEKTNRVRKSLGRLDELMKTDPVPLTSADIFFADLTASLGYCGGDADRTDEIIQKMCEEAEERIEQGFGAYPEGAPRFLMIGNYHKLVYPLIEKYRVPFVCDFPSEDHGAPLLRDEIKINGDIMDSLAEHYLKSHGIFDTEHDVRDVLYLLDKFDIDAVYFNRGTDAFGWSAHIYSESEIKEAINERGLPVLEVPWELFYDKVKLESTVKAWAKESYSSVA